MRHPPPPHPRRRTPDPRRGGTWYTASDTPGWAPTPRVAPPRVKLSRGGLLYAPAGRRGGRGRGHTITAHGSLSPASRRRGPVATLPLRYRTSIVREWRIGSPNNF